MNDDFQRVDPETHERLRLATEEELAALREAIAKGEARRRDGEAIGPFEGAYVTADGSKAYPIVDGVPVFLVDERIERR